jgi:ATP-dependent Lon protease
VIKTIVAPHLGLVKKGGKHRMSPVLLVGEPGIGKTFFSNALAKMLGFNSALFIDFSSETNGGALAGSSVFWSNSNPGKLFDCLAWGTGGDRAYANPVIVLDEIDKISGRETYNPIAALYAILESETAAKFQDQAVPDVLVDCSRVRFYLTANDATKIPEPLLSRLTVFHIPPPSDEQLRAVVRNIYSALAEEIGLGLPRRLSEDIIDLAAGISPREAKVRLECAIAKAVSAGRKTVRASDWPVIPTAASQKRKMGF